MNILLLGAGGFLGSHIAQGLIDQDTHDVVGLDLTDEKLDEVAGPNFRFVTGDVRDIELVERHLVGADVVVDLVSYANPSIYIEQPLDVFDLNFRSNLAVADLCVERGARLVQFSTSEVYGQPVEPTYREDHSPLVMGPVTKQRWIYATAKALLERVLHAYGLEDRLDYTIIRPFNVIGSRLDYLVPAGTVGGPRVFSHFMSALLTGGPMYLVNGGHAHRTFTHIADATAAFLALLEHPGAFRQIFNLGNPSNHTSIRELATLMMDLFEEMTGERPKNEVIEIEGEDFYGEGYEDTDRVPPDISKLRALGWEPRHGLRATLGEAMRYYFEREHAAIS